ncbi:MAG: hypothetical protein ABSF88_08820 [Candidatus Aminicenantales bacterium]
MKKKLFVVLFACGVLGLCVRSFAQLKPEEVADRAKWEEFLKTAEIIDSKQITEAAVTHPWTLTLKQGDVTKKGLWKDVSGRPAGYIDSWKYEVAGYEMDKILGLGMVPVTIERRFNGNRGSLQLWIDDTKSLKKITEENIKKPSYRVFYYNRALYLQRAFDNLIANEDRHLDNYLIVLPDWRMILIDHSRSFRTTGKFIKQLIYTEKHPEGPMVMKELPKAFFEKIKALTYEQIKTAVGEYLTDEEIKCVMIRKDLVLAEMDKLIKKNGEESVIYEK